MATLSTFLSNAAARGFVWGTHDCMMFAADWALALSGKDPAAGWRGTYGNSVEAAAIVDRAGGAQAHMHRALEPCGWKLIDGREARAGDIVLAHVPRHIESAAGICLDGKAALLTKRGVVVWPVPFIAAWRHHG